MFYKIALFVFCAFLVQASVGTNAPEESTGVTTSLLSRSRRSCGAGECNQHCKRLGHARGVCIGTYCQCRSRLRRDLAAHNMESKEEESNINKNIPETKHDKSDSSIGMGTNSEISDVIKSRRARATCGYDECNRFCRKLGHARGVCIGNLCQCRFRRRRSIYAENVSDGEIKPSDDNLRADGYQLPEKNTFLRY